MKKFTTTLFKISLVTIISICSLSVIATTKHSGIVANLLRIESYEKGNDFSEEEFDYLLDTLVKIFAPEIENRGGILEIKRDWQDGAVNAFSWREGRYYMLEILGGLARHPLITKDAFALLVCHEMGHLLGGSPSSYEISYEGQADYYAPMKCMRKLLPKLNWKSRKFKIPQELISKCSNTAYCQRNLSAGLSLTRLYAKVQKLPPTNFLTPDTHIIDSTTNRHPVAQCRLDTYVASSMCPIASDISFSKRSLNKGACSSKKFPEFQRSKCWYKELL